MVMHQSACVLEVNKDYEVYVPSFAKVFMQLRNADAKTPTRTIKCTEHVLPLYWASYSYPTCGELTFCTTYSAKDSTGAESFLRS
jgi:hypothetical protein